MHLDCITKKASQPQTKQYENGDTMSDNEILDNQKTILNNQNQILKHQVEIQDNQKEILANQQEILSAMKK